MYIRMLNFQTNGNNKDEVTTIMDNIIPKIRSKKGCQDCIFITHESDDHYALLVFWESKEQADAAADIIGPQLIPALNRISKEAIIPRLYEVHQPEMVIM
jgi:hypothetical protein